MKSFNKYHYEENNGLLILAFLPVIIIFIAIKLIVKAIMARLTRKKNKLSN